MIKRISKDISKMKNVDDYINEIDENITSLELLRDSEDMNLMYGFEYNLICDAIELLRSTKEAFEMRKDEY